MLSIVDKLATKQTGMRSPLLGVGVTGDLIIDKTGNSQPQGFGTNDEYEMTLTVATKFWAGSASKERAFEAAKKCLLHNVYADLLSKVSAARSAAIGQDYKVLELLLNDIERTVIGE
jgi:hypothetical protein